MNNKFWNAPAWSMGTRSASLSKQVKSNPGPGNYNLSGKNTNIGCKIGNSLRNIKNNLKQPGPGNYDVGSKNFGPQITIGKKFNGSSLNNFNSTPGPGQYSLSSHSKQPGITLGFKHSPVKLNSQEPGPGAYNLNNNSKSGVKIGNSNRGDIAKGNKIPGPGSYTYDKRPYSAGPKYKFGNSGRSQLATGLNVGPGAYDIKSTIKEGQGCTMGQRFNSKELNSLNNPGPGDYDLDKKRPASGTKIGRAKRNGFDGNITPGPGAYGQDQNYKSTYGTKIGTSKRTNMGVVGVPGPGSYNLAQDSRGGVTISGHKGKLKPDTNPGPGSYDPNQFGSKNRPGSAHMGKSQRSGFKKADTPGPGQYYHQEDMNCKFAYTKQLRSKEAKKGDPGPGQYEIPSSVPSAPHYLIDPSVYKSGGSKI